MTVQKRSYNIKNVELLMVASVVVENALHHIDELSHKRTTWTSQYFLDLKTKIDYLAQTVLGYDNLHQLKQKTQQVQQYMAQARELLNHLKVQIQADYSKDPEKRLIILQNLGFNLYYIKMLKHDQEATIQLLFRIKTNLTSDLKIEFVNNGINEATIDQLFQLADALLKANTEQEKIKGVKKQIASQNLQQLIHLHLEIANICKIARVFFKGNPVAQNQFNFTKIAKNLNTTKASKTTTPTNI